MENELETPGGITIRAPLPRDGDAVRALAQRFATSFAVQEGSFRSSFTEIIAEPTACLRVAEVERRIVGYVLGFDHQTFFANGRVAWVEEIMVAEDLRTRGVGRLLMRSFEAWA